MESHTETQNYKHCFLINRNGVGISGTIIAETNSLIDDEVAVNIELGYLLVVATCQWKWNRYNESIEVDITSSISAVTQFIRDSINLHIVSIYWNAPLHLMGLIKVTSREPPSADDWRSAAGSRVKLKALDKAKILNATEINILLLKKGKTQVRHHYVSSHFWTPPWCHKISHSSLLETYSRQQDSWSSLISWLPALQLEWLDWKTSCRRCQAEHTNQLLTGHWRWPLWLQYYLHNSEGVQVALWGKSHHLDLWSPHLAQGCGYYKASKSNHYSKVMELGTFVGLNEL